MKQPDRKVLKLGISQKDLNRFVQVKEEEGITTLSRTLSFLLDIYDRG
jgi:hypothetical protein